MSTEPNGSKNEDLEDREVSLANKALEQFARLLGNPFINSDEALVKDMADFEKKLHDPKFLLDDPENVKRAFSDIKTKIKSKIVIADKMINAVENKITRKEMEHQKMQDALTNYNDLQKQKNKEKLDAVNRTIISCQSQYQAIETLLKPYRTIGGLFQRGFMRNKKMIGEYDQLKEKLRLFGELLVTLREFHLQLEIAPNSKFPRLSNADSRMIELRKSFESIDSQYYLDELKQNENALADDRKHEAIIKADIVKREDEIKSLRGDLNQLNDAREELKDAFSSLNQNALGSQLHISTHRRH